jgi:hypothetical protein
MKYSLCLLCVFVHVRLLAGPVQLPVHHSLHAGKHHASFQHSFRGGGFFVNEEESGHKAGLLIGHERSVFLQANLWDINLENRLLVSPEICWYDQRLCNSSLFPDLSLHVHLWRTCFAAMDLDYAAFRDLLESPGLRTSGEFTFEPEHGVAMALRYSYDPACGFGADLFADYAIGGCRLGLTASDVLGERFIKGNVRWEF